MCHSSLHVLLRLCDLESHMPLSITGAIAQSPNSLNFSQIVASSAIEWDRTFFSLFSKSEACWINLVSRAWDCVFKISSKLDVCFFNLLDVRLRLWDALLCSWGGSFWDLQFLFHLYSVPHSTQALNNKNVHTTCSTFLLHQSCCIEQGTSKNKVWF